MKKSIYFLFIIILFVFFLATNTYASTTYPVRGRFLKQARLMIENDISLEWINNQIKIVLDQLEALGFDTTKIENYLDSFFSEALGSLLKGGVTMPYLNDELFNIPPYNINWSYNLKTKVMDFTADNFMANEYNCVFIQIMGDSRPEGIWNLNFSLQTTSSNQNNALFYKYKNKETNSSLSSWINQYYKEFILEGELNQDGLRSLYLNPCQVTSVDIFDITYTTKSGLEILQDTELKKGNFYLDIFEEDSYGNKTQVYYWETPLW